MGFYGLGSAELDYQVANMMIPGDMPSSEPMSGVVTTQLLQSPTIQ